MLGAPNMPPPHDLVSQFAALFSAKLMSSRDTLPNAQPWSENEDTQLLMVFDELKLTEEKSQLWYSVADALLKHLDVARTPFQCKYRVNTLRNKDLLNWSFDEDKALLFSFTKGFPAGWRDNEDRGVFEQHFTAALEMYSPPESLSGKSTEACRMRIKMLLDDTFIKPPSSDTFSEAQDTVLLDAVGRMCGHERLMDVAAVDLMMNHKDWVHIAINDFKASKRPTQCKHRFFNLMINKIAESTPHSWTDKEIEKLSELVESGSGPVNWNVAAAVMQDEGTGKGPSARECCLQHLATIRNAITNDPIVGKSAVKQDTAAGDDGVVTAPWTTDEDEFLLTFYDTFATDVMTKSNKTYDKYRRVYLSPNWDDVTVSLQDHVISTCGGASTAVPVRSALECERRFWFLFNRRQAAHQATTGGGQRKIVILGGDDTVKVPKKLSRYLDDIYVDPSDVSVLKASKKRPRANASSSQKVKSVSKTTSNEPLADVSIPPSFVRVPEPSKVKSEPSPGNTKKSSAVAASTTLTSGVASTVSVDSNHNKSRQQCFIVPCPEPVERSVLQTRCISIRNNVGFRYFCFQREQVDGLSCYKGYIHWGKYQDITDVKKWLRSIFEAKPLIKSTGGFYKVNKVYCKPENGADFTEFIGEEPKKADNSDGDTTPVAGTTDSTPSVAAESGMKTVAEPTKKKVAKRGKWQPTEDTLLLKTVFSLSSTGAPFTWAFVAAAFEGTRTRLSCERRYVELVGPPASGRNENNSSSSIANNSNTTSSSTAGNSQSNGISNSTTENSNNSDDDVVFVKSESKP